MNLVLDGLQIQILPQEGLHVGPGAVIKWISV